MLSPVRWHSVWNKVLFLMYYSLAIRTVNFSLSCSLWCCSIARWNGCVSVLSIPVAAWSKAWSATARLPQLEFRIPLRAGRSLSCGCYVFLDRGFNVGLITRLEVSYRVCCVWMLCRSSMKEDDINKLLAEAPQKWKDKNTWLSTEDTLTSQVNCN